MAFSQFGTNSNARRKRVKYIGTSIIREGMPVCYDFDATDNILGYDKGNSVKGSTTAEGNQNEGKFMQVEDPADNNLQHFAGVVAGASYAGLTGPRWLDIYIPNGAIVPVRCSVDTTVGRTILAIQEDTNSFVLCTTAEEVRPVAIAMETETALGSTADITLAKLDPNLFIYQEFDTDLLAGAGGDSSKWLQGCNHIAIEVAHVAGGWDTFRIRTVQSGILAAAGGGCSLNAYLKVTGSVTSSVATYQRAILGLVHLEGCTLTSVTAIYTGGHFQIGGTPASFTTCGGAFALWADAGLAAAPDAGDYSIFNMTNNGNGVCLSAIRLNAAKTTNFLSLPSLLTATTGANHILESMTGDHGFDSNDYALKVDIQGTTYYIPVIDALG